MFGPEKGLFWYISFFNSHIFIIPDVIVEEDFVFDQPECSTPSPSASTSTSSTSESTTQRLPSTPSSARPGKKNKYQLLHEEILDEIRKGNEIAKAESEHYIKSSETSLQLERERTDMMRFMIQKTISIQEKLLDTRMNY